MNKAPQLLKILGWLKMFAFISATVLLITNNRFDKMTYLIPLLLLLFFADYAREYWLTPKNKPIKYEMALILLEFILIIGIGFFDESDISLLLFYVIISAAVIVYPLLYVLPFAVLYITAAFFMHAGDFGLEDPVKLAVSMLFSYGISTAFVMGMSYLVKIQIREKEKLARMKAELEQAYEKLIENSAAAQRLSIEAERTRMAREIHDTLAHTLTSLILQLEVCKKLVKIDPARLSAELDRAEELSRSGFSDVKRSIQALRPQALEQKTLSTSILSIADEISKSYGVHINFQNLVREDIRLTSQAEVALFRAVQESITNSIRHGQSSEIEIILRQAGGSLEINIADNGIGCANIKKGYGLMGIRERIEGLSGTVEFSSASGKGFRTKVSVPCKAA